MREKAGGGKSGNNNECYEKIIEDLLKIYHEGNIPTKPRKKVKEKFVKLWEEIKLKFK